MKSWKFLLIAFVSGAVLGGLASALLPVIAGQESGPEIEASPVEAAAAAVPVPEERARLLKRIEKQREEIALLKSRLPQAVVVGEPAETSPEEAEQEARRENFRSRMEERLNRRADDMVLKLGLDEGQRQLLQEIYRQQYENFRARREGEDVELFNFDGAMESILTPEQFEAYLESSQEEIYNRAELMATTQMVRLSQTVDLTSEQEGLVYDAIHFTAQEAMISRQTGADYNMREMMNERLSTILTEEQLQSFAESGGGFRGPGPGRGFPGP